MIPDYIKTYNVDCMEFMASVPDKHYDLAIVDPPYRDENQPTKDMRKNGSMDSIKGRPKPEYWYELLRVSRNQIIWGANNFELPQWKGFIVWKKKTISEDFTMSMCEIAALSENLSTTSKFIELAPQGTKQDPRIHPNQKPVALYKWLLKNYAKAGDKILDTHGGSMSIAISIHDLYTDLGCSLDICELDEDYYKAGLQRIETHCKQLKLF